MPPSDPALALSVDAERPHVLNAHVVSIQLEIWKPCRWVNTRLGKYGGEEYTL
jgi:hypothetical protein